MSTQNALSNEIEDTKINLVCPKCNKQNIQSVSSVQELYNFTCPNCKTEFQSHIVKIRSKRSRGNKKEGKRYYSIRVEYFSGREHLIEFANRYSAAEIELRAKDLAAFSYLFNSLKIVQNLTINQYNTVSEPACYLATSVYGYNSEEVEILRHFRDEILLRSKYLAILVHIYYLISYHIVKHIGNNRLFRGIVLIFLNPLVKLIKISQTRHS